VTSHSHGYRNGTKAAVTNAATVPDPNLTPFAKALDLTAAVARVTTLESRQFTAQEAIVLRRLIAAAGGGTTIPAPPPTGPVLVISPTGNDTTGTGSSANPWQTVQKFYDSHPAPGDSLYCRGGTYPANSETVITDPSVSGTSGSPITVRNYPAETPVFPGGIGYNALRYDGGCSYHVMDGLRFTGYAPTSGAIIWVGHTDGAVAGATLTHHITFRNLHLTKGSGGNHQSHGLYNSWMSDHVTLEDSIFIGASEFDDGNAAVHAYHPPNTTGLLVQRCILDSWYDGFLLWDGDPPPTPRHLTASILHNTIVNCEAMIDARYHAALLVRDNVGQLRTTALYDPNDAANTTADHNYFAETLTGHALQAGSSAIHGALDGSDAGAVPYTG
jgi:hypothetical protein